MDATLLYMTDDSDTPQSYHTEEPFRMTFACDLSLPDSLVLTPGNIEVNPITSDRVEIKYILHLDCWDVKLARQGLVTQVNTLPPEEAEPGILLCLSQSGETTWDIAKRYRVSPESLKRMNPELADGSAKPQRVILWRRQG